MKLQGKSVLVTGGTSGIGLATAQLFLQQGARVAITGRSAEALANAQKQLGDQVLALRSDTSKLSDIDALANTLRDKWGQLDAVFVNAGIAKFAPLADSSEALWDETFAINLKGAFFTVKAFAPLVRDGGAFVLNTSVVDEKGMPNTSVYSASKAGLRSLARTLASELVARRIRVNAVSPGPIETPIFGKLGLPPEALSGMGAQMREMNPMKRFGRPDEVAAAVAYLAFDATYTTGEELVVDGGLARL